MNNLLELQKQFETTTSPEQRKLKGQFFTPPEIARFVAGLFSFPIQTNFRLLDPGAGIGTLSSAFCERVSQLRANRRLEVHLYETDQGLLPSLRRSMEHSKQRLAAAGHRLFYFTDGQSRRRC